MPLLREDAGIYSGRGTGDAERLRGFILASFGSTGLPEAALPYVLEELETGRNPYTVAAAARAVRRANPPPAGAAALIERALTRIRRRDDYVDFDAPSAGGGAGPTTATAELAAALADLTPARACCGGSSGRATAPSSLPPDATARLGAIAVEDQDGTALTLGALLRGRASLLTFFYTRCMNPEKCSLTISKLARLQRIVAAAALEERIVLTAISYDPAFDLPKRLRDYGEARGLRFGATCRLLRTTGPFDELRDLLSLGVGYGEATVNRHRLELFLFRPDGSIAEVRTRRLWDEEELFAGLAAMA